MKNTDRRRRARDLADGLYVVALVGVVAAIPAADAYDATGHVPAWAWLLLVVPAALLVALVANWLRGRYLPPARDKERDA